MATARSAPSAMRVVEYASAPEQPVWPKTKLLLLGAVAFGLIAGVIGALLLELVFVRVNRYRLLEKDDEYRVFAIVDQDEKFLDQLYPAGPLRR
jgi:capsular polysaccharide biosynthesis protein